MPIPPFQIGDRVRNRYGDSLAATIVWLDPCGGALIRYDGFSICCTTLVRDLVHA
jgi:hypothetical protein